MRSRRAGDWIGRKRSLALLAAALTIPAYGQFAGTAVSGPGSVAGVAAPALGEVVREIDDPNTGDRWLLLRDSNHPGGPGRLVLTEKPESTHFEAGLAKERPRPVMEAEAQMPVIRSGDRLIVERNTAVVEERLEAVALGPAVKGSSFELRLAIGGKVFRAVALGPGRAMFDEDAGRQP